MNNLNINLDPKILKNLDKNKGTFINIYNDSFEKLAKEEIGNISKRTKSEVVDRTKLILNFFKRKVFLEIKNKKIYYLEGNQKDSKKYLDIFSSVLILHYLLNADGAPLENRWISFRELPDGLFYWRTILKILEPLAKKYESSGDKFLTKIMEIGGKINKGFEHSSTVYPFKMFPVLMILYEKDEEFEASFRVLFDSSAPHYLKTDVIKMIILYIVKKLCS